MEGSLKVGTVGIRPVRTLLEAMRVRSVRNTVRFNMTHDTSYIGAVRQAVWYYRTFTRNRETFDMYLVTLGHHSIGYGVVRLVDGKWWITGGIVPEHQGRGYGRVLFSFLTRVAVVKGKGCVWLDVREENTKAQSLYSSLGYEHWSSKSGILVMRVCNQ